jgi:ADP-ribosylglycohydrolase
MLTRDKVLATILGAAVGDALGMPVEGWSGEKIRKTYGRVTRLMTPKDHKHFSNKPAGWWTDDTALTLGILRSLAKEGTINLESVMEHQLAEYEANKDGFGPKTNTALSLERYKVKKEGWKHGDPEAKGNGIAMKSSPFGLFLEYISSKYSGRDLDFVQKVFANNVRLVSFVSHANDMSFASGMVQAQAVKCCLENRVSIIDLVSQIVGTATLCGSSSDVTLLDRLKMVHHYAEWFRNQPPEDISSKEIIFGRGGCYIPDSLPFTYMFFLRNPYDIESLFELVSAGGDTDTNGSMCGALLGATNGMSLFKGREDLYKELWRLDDLNEAVQAFCDKFDIK